MDNLKFSFGNRKVKELGRVQGVKSCSFDLPAGYTCPMADICQSFANKETGKITDGANCQFRCYAASLEAAFKPTRALHWYNFELLKGKSKSEMVELIQSSLPPKVGIIRIHSSGDFFNEDYFNAWVEVTRNNPHIRFFAYTKVLNYVSADTPDNFKLVYSYGGKMDNELSSEPVAYVTRTLEQAIELGVPVSCEDNPVDDFDYIMAGKSFALMLHGTQPAGRGK